MSELPSGTITFLYTDIEGSTRLRQAQPEAYARSLALHDEILRQAIAAHAGFVFKTIGDAFCAAFHLASRALLAAVDAQRQLQAADWGAAPIRVRMALHTGAAELRDGEYYGFTLARIARLLPAGHGGQVLLSSTAAGLVADQLPEGTTLRDMGEKRLKDLARPEQIFQLIVPGLPTDFPPLKTLDAYLHNLPTQLTSFIGRQRQLVEVRRLLHEDRLVSLLGPGGAGKTRLALQASADLVDVFPHGVWLVELAPIADQALVPRAVATALGLPGDTGGQTTITAALAHYLNGKELLLILDNCEHVVEACADLADALLHASPGLVVLATTRESLGIVGERTYQVPSLALPDLRQRPSVESLNQNEAVQLFVERAIAVKPGYQLTEATAPAVAEICHRLDGIPLALELAAARVKVLGVTDLLRRLDDRFRLLTAGSRTALPRQQTLAAAIDWSYQLLSDSERTLFRRLAVFAGGWNLEAAEAVAGAPPALDEVLNGLAGLVNKSLVVVEGSAEAGQARYRMLETIRQYALDKLVAHGEAAAGRDRHLAYFMDWAESAAHHLTGKQQLSWLQQFAAEHDNLRAALEWGQQQSAAAEQALRLAVACGRFWRMHGYLGEGRARLAAALSLPGVRAESLALLRVSALYWTAVLAYAQSDYAPTRAHLDEALALARTLGPAGQAYVARLLVQLGEVDTEEGDYPTAGSRFEEGLSLFRSAGDLDGAGDTLIQIGWAAMRTGDYVVAEARLEDGLLQLRRAENTNRLGMVLSGLGELAVRRGDYARATRLLEESLANRRERGEKWGAATVLGSLGWVALRQGDYERMRQFLGDSLALRLELDDRGGMAWCLEKLAEASLLQGPAAPAPENERYFMRAARAFGAAEALRAPVGSVVDPVDQPEYERNVASLRSALGDAAFSTAWAEGQSLPPGRAISEALGDA
jgi:predicted ATPase/class 3 adenylate cyclase